MIVFNYPPGATPIDPEETQALLQGHITTHAELNEVEAMNVAEAVAWTEDARIGDPLTSSVARELHRRMFNEVWQWAGQFRNSEKNIGVAPHTIAVAIEELMRDTRYQIKQRAYDDDEIAARFHHRLVWIHCFPNGNGRHARLITDLLLTRVLKRQTFSWGSATLENIGPVRQQYIYALRTADTGDIQPLLKFVRS